jgi:hypothetical protein
MELSLNNRSIRVYTDGKIEVLGKKGWFFMKQSISENGYYKIRLYYEGKQTYYRIHRIVAYAYLELDINNTKQQVDHIDGNRLNNDVSNLRIVTNQQNSFNRLNIKGYEPRYGRFRATIKLNGKHIRLGTYDTEEEARQAYLRGKEIHHLIPKNIIST